MWAYWGVLALVAVTQQATTGCKNCISLSKADKSMLRLHSDACLPQSGVDPELVDQLLSGRAVDTPALRKHVYCVMHSCKIIGKDGKMHKSVHGVVNNVGRNLTKAMESCTEQTGETPEDLAWNLFKCGFDKKTFLFDHNMASSPIDNNN